jgi:nicotinamide-nucleotide amidase
VVAFVVITSPVPWSDHTMTEVGQLAELLRARGWLLATAESCTGGLIAAACTAVAGSSDWFDRGFVTYSNASKTKMLGVPAALIEAHGAVSQEVALAMAQGALAQSSAQLAVAVTGVAGPGGGSPEKPVGTVWVATAGVGAPGHAECFLFAGDRASVRMQTVTSGLALLLRCASVST